MVNPEKVAFPSIAFKVASWFWTKNAYIVRNNGSLNDGNFNELADGSFLKFSLLTFSMTSSIESLKERAILNEKTLAELNYLSIKRGEGIKCQVEDDIGYAVPICLSDFRRPYCGCDGKFQKSSCPYGYNPSGKCRNPEIIKCCVEKCTNALDLVILMDSSGSIGQSDFEKEKKFVYDLVSNLDVGFNETRIGIMTFSDTTEIITDFSKTTNKSDILNRISKIKYIHPKSTNTANALIKANKEILVERKGMRPLEEGVPKIVLVITDGVSDDTVETLKQAKKIKERGISMISIGIGKEVNMKELKELATIPNNQYLVENFDSVLKIINSISTKTCKQPAQAGIEIPISSRVDKDSFKYFELSLTNQTSGFKNSFTMPKNFTIELKQLNGSAELFYSFDEKYPKSKEDYISNFENLNATEKKWTEKFKLNKKSNKKVSKFYNVNSALSNLSKTLYISVKGFDYRNEFQIFVHDKMLNSDVSKYSVYNIIVLIFSSLINIIIFY